MRVVVAVIAVAFQWCLLMPKREWEKGKGQRAKGKGQRAKGKGQRAKGKGQRAKGKGQRHQGTQKSKIRG
jgi:hypothetical protein